MFDPFEDLRALGVDDPAAMERRAMDAIGYIDVERSAPDGWWSNALAVVIEFLRDDGWTVEPPTTEDQA